MADSGPNTNGSAAHREEKTFRSYSKEQGSAYAQHRAGYKPKLYDLIISHHTTTGGSLNVLLDVGCGPGTAVSALAPRFSHAIGLDPSEGMIAAARSLGGTSSTGDAIDYQVSTAEDLAGIASNSVDLITVATAAHWFDMARFWRRAAQVLKPGGSVAIWTSGSMYPHPSMPAAAGIRAAIDELEDEVLRDYMQLGNLLSRSLYEDLPLPWTLPAAAGSVEEFDEASFLRKVWNKGGEVEPAGEFFFGQQTITLDMMEMAVGTASPVTRWREAHPDDVGTERDVTRIFRRKIERLLHEAGVERGKEMVTGGLPGVLLIVKKA